MREHTNHEGADEFVQRIVRPLQAPERLDASFEARVMSAVRRPVTAKPVAERVVLSHRGWWRRARTIQLSPLAGLAAAAGIMGLAALGGLGGALAGRAAQPEVAAAPSAAAETVHVVRFVLVAPDARGVSLVGDFNDWSRDAAPLMERRDGVWTASVPVPRGRHEYAFIVHREHGDEWVADPYAATSHDDFGTETSIVTIGGATGAPNRPNAS